MLSTCSGSIGRFSSYLHTQLFFSGILQLWWQVYVRPYGTSCSTGNSSSTSNEDVWCCHSNFFLPVRGMSILSHFPAFFKAFKAFCSILGCFQNKWLAVKTLAWASAKLSSDSIPKNCVESGHVLVLYKDGIWCNIAAPTFSVCKVRKSRFGAPEWGQVPSGRGWTVGTHSSAVPMQWAASAQPPCLGLFMCNVDSGFLSRKCSMQTRGKRKLGTEKGG